MKKFVILCALIIAIAGSAFAQYTVAEVNGRVEVLIGRTNDFRDLVAGERLTDESFIRTGIGARVVLIGPDSARVYIGGGQLGMIMDIKTSRTISQSGSVRITDTSAATRQTARVGTASARASDAAADLEFHE